MREAIISGQFAESEPVRQDDMARLFNVSEIPVCEALKRLEATAGAQRRHAGVRWP
ncbi:GntR family transcriptional regulator [Stutzerimonas stutzeri]|uniref:GntR family transcriptional regulator n=1 Tax=Stutzerimonas stutzeri TaxID=316 RepID=UPI003C6F3AC7